MLCGVVHAQLSGIGDGRCARVAELEEVSKTKASKVRAKHRAADIEVVAEQAHTKRTEHTARIAQLEGDLHKVKGKAGILGRLNNNADSRYFIPSNECDSLKGQIFKGGVCGGEIVQRFANASQDIDASMDDLNRFAV